MKKILVLMAMLTLASGAWAGDTFYSYQFMLGLKNISAGGSEGSTDSTLYFVNTNTKEIYAYFSRDDLSPQKEGQTEGTWQNLAYLEKDVATITYNGETYTGGKKTLTSASISKTLHTDNPKLADTTYKMDFTGTGLAYTEPYGVVDGLAALLYFNGKDTPLVYDAKTLSTPFMSMVVETQVQYSAYFTKAVPEPTSGLLLLLGIAGLALKRRKVA